MSQLRQSRRLGRFLVVTEWQGKVVVHCHVVDQSGVLENISAHLMEFHEFGFTGLAACIYPVYEHITLDRMMRPGG